MNRIAVVTAVAAFGLAPALGWADCGGAHDDTAASATPPAKMALAPPAEGSRVPVVTKAALPRTTKKAAVKPKAPAPEERLVSASIK